MAVESSPGAGTVFRITLPRVFEQPGALAAPLRAGNDAGIGDDPARRGRGRRPRPDAPRARAAGLHRARLPRRARGDRPRRGRGARDRLAPHRRRHAGHARLRGRQACRPVAAEDPHPLHVRLRRGDPRRPAGALRARADREAVRGRRARPPRPRSTRAPETAARMPAPRGRSSVGRASASQAEGRGFEPHRPLTQNQAETRLPRRVSRFQPSSPWPRQDC